MATKNYDNFDFDEYQRNQNKNSNNTGYDNYDFDAVIIRQNLPKIGEYFNSSVNSWLKKNESFYSKYNKRIGRYQDKDILDWEYEADSSDWLSAITTQKSNLENEAKEIKTWLDQYKDYLDADYYNSVVKTLDGNIKNYGSVLSHATELNQHWSSFETEDKYNEWITENKEHQKKLAFDLSAGKSEIDDIQKALDEYSKLNLQIAQRETAYAQAGYTNPRETAENDPDLQGAVARINELSELYGVDARNGGLKSLLSEKKAYYTLAERAQELAELESVANVESENYDPAFAQKSQYQTTKFTAETFWDKFHATEYDLGYDDLTHEYINGDEDFRAEVRSKHTTYSSDNPYSDGKSRFEEAGYDYMEEDEIAIYNYYYNTEGKEKAEEYLDSLEETLQYRYGKGMATAMKGKPVLQYLFAIEAGIDQFASGIAGIFSDEYTPTSATQIASGLVREDLADDSIPIWYNFKEGEWEDEIFGSSLGQVGYDVLNTTSNMLPSILTGTAVNLVAPGAGAFVGAGLLGASAGGNAKVEMLNLGYSKEQANAYGAMVAIAEGSMEYLLGGITKLGGKLPDGVTSAILSKVDNALARTAIKLGGSMLSEGFEEGLQTVIEPWLKEMATGVDWDDPSVDEVLYSSLLGALSAFGLEGAGVVAGEVKTYKSGKTVQKIDGGVERLQKLGQTFSADTVAHKIASKVNAQTDAYTIGRLLNEVGGTISEQNVSDIANGLIAKGMDSKTANKLARQYQAILNSEMNITDEQVKILENLSPLADVLRKNIIGANTTVYQRTRAYSDLMSLADEVSNSKKGKASKNKDKTPKSKEVSAESVTPEGENDYVSQVERIASEIATGKRESASERFVKNAVDSASATAAERLGVEGRYASSETGRNRLASNRKRVNIVGVDSIDDGVMKLKLDDGSVVGADEIDFSSSNEALVYEAVTNMGVSPTTAWEIIKRYDPKSGQSGTIYAMGALEAYTYGHNGIKVDGMSKDGFSALLSPIQRNTANRLGDIDARAKVEAKQKTIDKAVKSVRDEAKSKHKAIPLRKGQTVFEGDRERLTDLQEKQLGVLEKVAEGLGVTFHIFESKVDAKGKRYYTMPNGKITSANGWYDTKTGEIWIDLHAGNDGQGTMIFTAAHELTHFIRQWSPAKFKIFADFLFEQYGKKGQDVNQLIRNQITKAANNGRSISWDEAYEEVIADSCETFLRDSKASEKIAALREKDAGLANKIKSFLGQMLTKLRKLMADLGLAPETEEGKMVAKMTDSLQKLYDLWTDALADAGKAYSTLAEIDFDTESVAPMFSERTWTASEYVTEREETAKKISKALGVDIKTAYKYIDDINSVARLIADDRARLDYEPNLDEHASVLKPNSEYKYSVDMSTLCAKRLLFTGTFDAIQRALPNTVFDSEDIVALREMMQKRGYEVACGICYVESTRREIGRITQDFINSYKESQKTGNPITRINSEGKAVDLKKTKDQKETTADKSTDKFFAEKDYTPTLADLNTTDIDIVKRDHPLVYEAYLNFMNARGQAKPKLLETRAEYKGEILKHFKAKSAVNARNNAGGLRLQSFSDFEVPHLIDMMQIVMDMARVGLKSQAYTKVPAFAEVFGDTGVKINLSLIAKGDGLDANGNLVFDDVEGINHKEAFKLRDKFSKNVGTILVGKTDAHIIAAMADPRIDYIIPFHKSSWKESLYDALGLTGYADYTDYQNEKPIDKDRKIKNFDPSEYWDFSKSGDENAQIYLEKCRKDGRIPKFPQFQGYPGYWKLLIDFKMYDNNGVGSPQEVVRPTFNTEASERILSEYKGGHKSFPVAKDVVEDFVKEHKDSEIRYSERKKKVDDTVDKAIKQKGNLGVKYNQERISEFPADITAVVSAASDGRIDLTGKYVAISGNEIWHEYRSHNDATKEVGRRQIPQTIESIKEAVMAIYSPDVVESLFTTNQNPTQRQSFAYAKKSPNGYYIVVEAVGGKKNPNVVPVMLLQFTEEKWNDMMSSGITLGEVLFENDTEKRNSLDVELNKKNRVTVAQFASKEAIANTPRSPRLENSIPHFEDSVNSKTEKNSLRSVEPIETSDYVKMYHHFGSTKNYDVAGYILGNGIMLDFSGKHWGDDFSTSRQVDHRDIQEVLGNRGSNNGVNAMIDMIGNGNIRLMPEVGGINLAVKPNSTQMSQLRGYINHFKGEVEIDIDAVGGDTIHTFRYTRGTASAKVIADINAYFDEGIVPQQKEEGETDIRQFLYSDRVTDKKTRDFLDEQIAKGEYDAETNPNGGYYVTYKSMSFWGYDEDGNAILRSPMAEYVDGKLSGAYIIPKDKNKHIWYQATETIDENTGLPSGLLVKVKAPGKKNPNKLTDQYLPAAENQHLIKEDWSNLYFNLKKKIFKNGKWEDSDVPARYNPYEHSSNSMLNDQFAVAYLRDNLVTVKMYVPVSEDNGTYRATWSKDPTGWTDWKTGVVAGKIGQQKDLKRRLYLSRYATPVEIVPDSEVAQAYKGYLEGTDVAIPDNVVSPNLLKELKKIGVPIKESGKLSNPDIRYSDRDSYAPTFYSKMGKAVEGIKLEKIGANSLVPFLKSKGVKNEEIKWSGIEAWLEGKKSVTKKELQEFIAGSQLQIVEQVSGEDIDLRYDGSKRAYNLYDSNGKIVDTFTYNQFLDGYIADSDEEIYSNDIELREALREVYGKNTAPKWADYKIDGGANYRELIFQLPNSSYSNQSMRTHWGEDAEGVLAHARIQDIKTKDGKKMLFIEEIQSDWHNEGHQKGYASKEYEEAVAVYDRLAEDYSNKRRAFNQYVRSSEFHSDPDEVSKKKFDWLRSKMETAEQRMKDVERDVDVLKENGMGDVPDAPFKNNYHEYVLKRLLRMAAEEGYDSIGWTPADIQSDRWDDKYAEGYRIEYDQDIPSFLKKYGKKWGATVGTAKTTEGYDVWSMDITNSMKDSILNDGQPLYSDRSPASVSTRSLLANALETTAQNDIERNKLEQYKSKIDLIEAEYAKLTELRAKIKELSFAKGARDTKAIKALQFEANQTANRINTYDRQLLNLESTTALKNVLQREKKMAYDKAKREGKDALAKQREKQAQTIRTLMDKNAESRTKAIEGRDKTAMRHKIRNIVDDLNKLLLNPTKDKHVPIGLQKPVASALAVINMDTVGAEERIAKYNDLIAKAKDPDEIAKLTKSRDNIELQGENLKDKLTALQNAYAALLKSDDPLVQNVHDESIENLIANTVEKVGYTSLRNMSLEQLEAVYDMFKAIKATVRNTNKMFKEGKQETITANSEWVKREVSAAGGHRDLVRKSTKWIKKFGWNMLKPIYAMKLIGSDTLTGLYENVRRGEDTWAVDVNEAKDFFKETASKYEYNSWDFKKQYKFTDSAGHSFSLTLEQIMSLYAYSKRKQADLHLENGGFIFDDSIEVTKKNKLGIPVKYEVNDANPYRLKKEDLAKVIGILDSDLKNVKGFVDEMQAYLSDVMGAKGNEVSLAMYDIKLYKEQNYFPLKTARYFRAFDPEKNGTPKIKNSGFSKNTVPMAGNPIVLSNFMDVWANHVNDMSMYHAFVLPLEDFMRVYNYSSTQGGYDSVQQYIKNAYGAQANAYIETLMNDLNGGARTDPSADLIGKGMSLFKKAAVFASASVVIQQPSAIARAMAYVDAKYFVDKPEATKHSETWAEVKKYAPVAIIKEMGYFDTNMGRSTVDWIKEEKTWRDKVDDIASKAPALADELAWCAIWKAVKREVADSTNLAPESEEFLKLAGKRFTEVVTKTQVYDSILSRSALMRSKDSGAKMITAFMAEPTTSLNMVVDGVIEGKRGNKKFTGKVFGAVAASIILNSILVSLVTAARDDDEDETYLEKYLESLTAELLDGFNPLTYIPLVKDIWSIMQGYDVERSDMSIWSDLWASVENLFSEKKSGFEKTEGVVGSIASMFGLPLKNLMRDARAIYNLASTALSGTPTTMAGIGEAIGGAVKDTLPFYSKIEKLVGADDNKADKLYDAIVSGNQNQIDRVKSQYKDDEAIESAIKQALRENDPRIKEAAKALASGDIRSFNNYINTIAAEGHFNSEMVESAIRSEQSAFITKVNKAAEAKTKGDDAEYKKLVRELRDSYRGIYSQDEIVNLVKKAQDEQLATDNDEDVEEATSVFKASDINAALESGDTEMALEVIDDLFNTKVTNYLAEAKKEAEENGKSFNERKARQEAEAKAKSSIRSSMTSYWKPLYKEAYKSGNTAEKERIERILKASGLYGNASEVIKTCREWRTERD